MKEQLHKFIQQPYDSNNSFNLAYEYFKLNQTATAFSFFLRCAEFTDNPVLSCECLLWCSKCLNNQKNRSQKEYDLILQAIAISPKTPHGYFIKCLYHSYRNEMMECYTTACSALELVDDSHKFIKDIGYTSKIDLYYQKAISGFDRGKLRESFLLFHKYFPGHYLLQKYNLETKTKYLLDEYFKDIQPKNDICICTISDREWMSNETVPNMKKYSELFNCDFYFYKNTLDSSRHISWSKLLLINYLINLDKFKYIIWIDDDILLTDFSTDIRSFIKNDKNIIISRDSYNENSMNCGFIICRSNQYTKTIFENIYNIEEDNKALFNTPWEQIIFQEHYIKSKSIQEQVELLPMNSIQSQYTSLFHNMDIKIDNEYLLKLFNRKFWKLGDFSAHFITHYKNSFNKEELGYKKDDNEKYIDKDLRLKSIKEVKKILESDNVVENIQLKIEDIENIPNISTHKNENENENININTPNLIVVDNFYKNPDFVRNYALSLEYLNPEDHGAVGYRCESGREIFSNTKEYFEQLLNKKIKVHKNIGGWDYSTNGCFQWCPLNTPIVYHSDSQSYAGIIYLTPDAPPECGTSIFRHKILKTSDSKVIFKDTWDVSDIKYKDPYINKHNWELVDKIGNVYNRLVIFKSHNIHAVSEYFGENIYNSRLFQLFFFDVENEEETLEVDTDNFEHINTGKLEKLINTENDYKLNQNIKHNLENFPKTIVLTIPQNKDRQLELTKNFKKYNIEFEFFECKKYPECNSIFKSNLNESLIEKHNLGVTFGHLNMLKYWYDNYTDDFVFLCEDDIDITISDIWNFTWNDFINSLNSDWSIIQLVQITNKLENMKFSPSHKLSNHWGITGYLIKRHYAKYIIDTHIISSNIFDLSLNYNNNKLTKPVLPEDLFFRQDELYNSNYQYPLSISLFIENSNYTNDKIHIQSINYTYFFYKNSIKDIDDDFIFIPEFDTTDKSNDLCYYFYENYENHKVKSLKLDDCMGFNTFGYLKKSLKNLKQNAKFKNKNTDNIESVTDINDLKELEDGIYIKKKYLNSINFI